MLEDLPMPSSLRLMLYFYSARSRDISLLGATSDSSCFFACILTAFIPDPVLGFSYLCSCFLSKIPLRCRFLLCFFFVVVVTTIESPLAEGCRSLALFEHYLDLNEYRNSVVIQRPLKSCQVCPICHFCCTSFSIILTAFADQQQVNGENVPEGWEHVFETQNGHGTGPRIVSMSEDLEVICGPLLNYQRMSEEGSTVYWHGSILIVTKPGQKLPQLELEAAGPQREDVHGNGFGQAGEPRKKLIDGLKLYSDPDRTFWRFSLQLPLADVEMRWRYTVARMKMLSEASEEPGRTFVVPSANESMRIMFHSCNGFSVGTDEDFWSGMFPHWQTPYIVLHVHQLTDSSQDLLSGTMYCEVMPNDLSTL